MNFLQRVFRSKAQGSDYIKQWEAKEGNPTVRRIAQLAGMGAGAGALVGLASGGIAARAAIAKAPTQEVTVSYLESVKKPELLGYIPADEYIPTTYSPSDDGIPNQPVVLENPVYSNDGKPEMRAESITFRGRGNPSPAQWHEEKIFHHKMDSTYPYNYRAVEETETYISHYEKVTKSREVPYLHPETTSECRTTYMPDGSSSKRCETQARIMFYTEQYEEQEPVYRERTVGFWQRYKPNIESKVVGTVTKPHVSFDHGVNVGSYLIKGLVFGAAIGALAGGITAALEERFFPYELPGYEPKPWRGV